jgi:MoaA/NifB/PqqE/SkfB family radical SAM enzyme
LAISFDVAPCEARCFHCSHDAGKGKNVKAPRLDALVSTAERYLRYRGSLYGQIGLHLSDAPLNYPAVVAFTEYARGANAVTGLVVNGASARDCRPTLRALKKVGEEVIQISLYGLGETHDVLAGRPGDFDLLGHIAEGAADAGLKLHFRIFVTKDNLAELKALDAHVRRFGKAVRKSWYDLWVMAGRGAGAEIFRPEEAERETARVELPAEWLSEREIIAKLDAGEIDAAYFAPRYNMLSFVVGAKGVRAFGHSGREADVPYDVDDDEKVLEYLSEKNEAEREQLSRMPELVALHGDAGNRRLYTAGGYRQLILRRAGLC